MSDNAHLTGTADRPGSNGIGSDGSINGTGQTHAGGTITFTLFKADCTTLAVGFPSAGMTASVNGDGYYGPVSFLPTEPGTYYWHAAYPGDSPNTNAATDDSPCPSDSEKVIVRQIPTSVKTKQDWIPNDTATVTASSGNLAAGGSVRFRLYATSDCSSTALYDETVSVSGGSPSAEVNTHNTGTGTGMLRITTGYGDAANSIKAPYSWLVVYTPAVGDTAHLGSSSVCNAEHFSTTYTNDAGP